MVKRTRVFDFKCEMTTRTSHGDIWKGKGFVGYKYYIVDGVFFGYTKKEIEKKLKEKIVKKANGEE